MKQTAFHIDTSACVGCKTCELACKDKNNLPVGVRLRKVREYGGGSWINQDGYMYPDGVFTYFVPASCMHCGEPACLEACPTDSISKDSNTGAVVINRETCIGCGSCLDACPYDAPSVNEEEEKTYKCDLCIDRLREGKNPVCVDSCLQRCLSVGEMSSVEKQFGKNTAVDPIPANTGTNPSVVFTAPSTPRQVINGHIRNVTEL